MTRYGDRDLNAPNLVELDGSGVHNWVVDELELGTAVAYGLHLENSVGWSELDTLTFSRAEAARLRDGGRR